MLYVSCRGLELKKAHRGGSGHHDVCRRLFTGAPWTPLAASESGIRRISITIEDKGDRKKDQIYGGERSFLLADSLSCVATYLAEARLANHSAISLDFDHARQMPKT